MCHCERSKAISNTLSGRISRSVFSTGMLLWLVFSIFSAPISAKQVKLGKRDVSQLAKLTLKLAQSLDEKNPDLLSELADPQLGIFFWNGECGCVVPARRFSADKKENFYDDPAMTPFYDDASRALSQGVAVLGKEKDAPKIAGYSETPLIPFASIEAKSAQRDFTALLYPAEKCPSYNLKDLKEEQVWLKKQSIVEIKMIQGNQSLNIFFRKLKGKFYVFHLMRHTACKAGSDPD